MVAHRSDRGIQASEVLCVASPSSFNSFGYGEMDALDDTALSEITLQPGWIKWFDPVKGFGFIVSDEIDMDILLNANVLRNFGQS